MDERKPIILHSINEECYDDLRKDLNTGCQQFNEILIKPMDN